MTDNYINVTVTSKENKRVTVSTQDPGFEVTATTDTGKFWAQTAENWATSDTIVENKDYSSKYYANKAKISEENARVYENAVKETYNTFLDISTDSVVAVQNASQNAVNNINGVKTEVVNEVKGQITVEAQKQIKNIQSTGFYMENDKLYFTNSKGEKEEFKSGGSSFNLFDTKISDHILDGEEAIGWMLQGSYVNGAVYPDFYAKCLGEYNEATETETVNGVTVKVSTNGHKFFDIADKVSIDGFFNTMGSAWFYGVDTENERIFLPRDKYFAVKGIAPVVGNGMTLGLTDGNQYAGLRAGGSSPNPLQAVPSIYGNNIGTGTPTGGQISDAKALGITTDPTKSGIEAHLESNEDKYLYICVGNTIVNEELIDVSKVLSEAVLRSSLVEVQTVIETYVNGTSWYRIWSDGWCEQGGYYVPTATLGTITLLKAYKNIDYSITTGGSRNANDNMYTPTVGVTKTASDFSIYCGSTVYRIYWQASGYIW